MSDIDRKKAEVRARLEAQAAGKKAKKGFMTPERKKKLRVRWTNAQICKSTNSCAVQDLSTYWQHFHIAAASEEKGNRRVEEGTRDESCWEEEGDHFEKNPQMNVTIRFRNP